MSPSRFDEKPWMTLGTMGHVDHGKSTVCGYLLYRKKEIPAKLLKEIEQIAQETGRRDKLFAFIMDRLPHERGLVPSRPGVVLAQSIETAYVGFETQRNRVMIVDNPGHQSFMKNMIRGTVNVDVGLLVVAADRYTEALAPPSLKTTEKTRRYIAGYARQHSLIAFTLGVEQLIVLVSKMDKVNYSQEEYHKIKAEVSELFSQLGLKFKKVSFVPTAVNPNLMSGENVANRSKKMPWYKGKTLVREIESFTPITRLSDKPLRLAIDGLYDTKGFGKIIGGKILSGKVEIGDRVIIEPGHVVAEVRSIKMRDEFKSLGRMSRWEEVRQSSCGQLVSIGLAGKQLDSLRIGNVLGLEDDPPTVAYGFSGRVFVVWHPRKSEIRQGSKYPFYVGTSVVNGEITQISNIKDFTGKKEEISYSMKSEETADIRVHFHRPIVVERYEEIPSLGRFTFLIQNIVSGAGIIAGKIAEIQ